MENRQVRVVLVSVVFRSTTDGHVSCTFSESIQTQVQSGETRYDDHPGCRYVVGCTYSEERKGEETTGRVKGQVFDTAHSELRRIFFTRFYSRLA